MSLPDIKYILSTDGFDKTSPSLYTHTYSLSTSLAPNTFLSLKSEGPLVCILYSGEHMAAWGIQSPSGSDPTFQLAP